MARKTYEELEKIKKKYKVQNLWSWSKYNTYKNSIYEYYLKYILKAKEDRHDGIYAVSGNMAHKILEKYYNNEIAYCDMLNEYEEALFTFNVSELKYDRTNEEKNAKIAEKYEDSIRHFFQNHDVINKKVDIERFILIKIGSFIFQGYIDFIFMDGKDLVITDWKTSSIYTGKKIDNEKGQLILYAEGLRQLGVPLKNIKIRWNFLKYATVEVPQANGKTTERNIIRAELGEGLKTNVKMWLKKSKQYSEGQIEDYLDMLVKTNDISFLPDDIQDKYKIKDCYVYIPFNQNEIDDLKEDIKNTIVEISKKEKEYSKTKDEKIWWEEIAQDKSYYFANLSGYSASLHKPYGEYLDMLEKRKNENIFGMNKIDKIDENDLSWLDEI